MRAAVWRDPSQAIIVENVELKGMREDEVRVEIAAAGVCHSDLHIVTGDWEGIAAPLVVGHEGSGVITEVGSAVTNLAVGDHVVLSWIAPCGRCRACLAGRPVQCLLHAERVSAGGVLQDGTSRLSLHGQPLFHYSGVSSFAEEAIVPAAGAIKVRDDAPLDVIALVGCGVATGVGAVLNTAKVERGASIVVVGCGGVGLSVVQGARIAGADTIIAVDLQAEKLGIASEVGATHTIDARSSNTLEEIRRIAPDGVDYAFDAIGGSVTASQCISSLAVGGTAVMVGIPRQGTEAVFEPQRLVDFDQKILGANYGGIVPSIDIPMLVDRYMNGDLLLDRMISARRPLEDADAAIKDLAGGSPLRQLLVP